MSRHEHIPEIRLRAIPVTGPDAAAFMQAQLTADLDVMDEDLLHPAAWCSPDGRVDTVLLVARETDRVTLVLPEVMVPKTFKRARMYSIGRNVTIEDDVAVRPVSGPAPENGRALALAFDRARLLQVDDAGPGGPLPAEWLGADIESGMPWIVAENAGAFLPQMLGLEALGGLSYRKGCFPGQEVIARVHYRGRVTRRTSQFRLRTGAPPAPGTEFDLAGKPARVLYAIAVDGPHAATIGLAVVAAEAENNAEIRIGSSPGRLVSE